MRHHNRFLYMLLAFFIMVPFGFLSLFKCLGDIFFWIIAIAAVVIVVIKCTKDDK